MYQVIICNTPDKEVAKAIALDLLANKLCVCVNIIPKVHSLYMWKSVIEEVDEVTMLIKTKIDKYAAIEKRIKKIHPYEVPEIIALEITSGYSKYLSWVDNSMM